MKGLIKSMLREVTAPLYARQPLRDWPAVIGRIHDLSVPKGTRPHPEPKPEGRANINILLHLLEKTQSVSGDVAECGVFRGNTLVPMALFLKQKSIRKRLFGFDSFEGFPDNIQVDLALGGTEEADKRLGGMNETSFELVEGKVRRFGLENVSLIKGYFEHTLPNHQDRAFSLVHLDCDTYNSYKECLEFFYPRLEPGGVVLLDEYNDPPWPGCNKAVDEFLANKPETLQPIVRDNYEKFYFIKSQGASTGT